MRGRQVLRDRLGCGRFGEDSNAHNQSCSQRQHQPLPFGARQVGHLGLLLIPTAVLHVVVATLDPGSHALPVHLGFIEWQLGQHHPQIRGAWFLASQHSACHLALGSRKTDHPAFPARTALDHDRTEALECRGLRWVIRASPVDAQVRVPSMLRDGSEQPFGVPA
jgi:hypothetical protein